MIRKYSIAPQANKLVTLLSYGTNFHIETNSITHFQLIAQFISEQQHYPYKSYWFKNLTRNKIEKNLQRRDQHAYTNFGLTYFFVEDASMEWASDLSYSIAKKGGYHKSSLGATKNNKERYEWTTISDVSLVTIGEKPDPNSISLPFMFREEQIQTEKQDEMDIGISNLRAPFAVELDLEKMYRWCDTMEVITVQTENDLNNLVKFATPS